MADTNSSSQRDDDIDLSELVGALLDQRWLIIGITAFFFVVSVAYAILATPVYQANAIVQVEQKVPNLPGLSALTQTLGASSSEATTEIALVTSRTVIGQAVDELGLTTDVQPKRFPMIGDFVARHFSPDHAGDVASPWLGFKSYDWGGSAIRVSALDVPRGFLDQALILVAGTGGSFTVLNGDGDTLVAGKAGAPASGHGVSITVESLKANAGTRFVVVRHRPLTVISQLQIAIAAAEQGKDSGIIELTYNDTNPELAASLLDHVSQGYVEQNINRNSAEAANSLKFVRQQMPIVRGDLEKATAALSAFQSRAHSVDITLQTKGLLDQEVAVESAIQELRTQLPDLERRFTAIHPAYRALTQQIGQLEAKKAVLEKQVGTLPDTQQELLRLTRDVQVTNETYTGLLNQAQQLDIARAGTVGNVRIIDPAAVDTTQPVKPRKAVIVIGGTFLGGVFALALVFLRRMLNRGVEDPSEIEQLGLPIYASIPVSDIEKTSSVRGKRIKGDGHQHLLVVTDPADLASESLRSLRTSLHFARMEAKNNVLMISGSSPEAGKTFVSANLAAVIAQAGQRVLLIDGDMRKGALHRVMGGKPERGLSDVVSGQLSIEEVTRTVPGVDTLHFISRGKVPPNPSELLMGSRFTAMIEEARSLYDLVLIDTPPILAVTDAAVIGQHAGTSLLVVRFGLNQAREIAVAKQRFEQNGVALKGAIFNAVERRASGYYSYGYYEYKSAT
ncbi:polysaccharide biosynthesis tyrosine autokinase [Bacillus sp. NP157]|nr:polysaccharide biosynthesis tyrosine autokinase [Bacillus sp. NP157]